MMFIRSFILILLLASVAVAQDGPPINRSDRARLGEAFRLSKAVGEQVWPGWRDVPFVVLLVTADREFLVNHPEPPDDFTAAGYDPMLKSKVYARPRQFETNLLATFPAVAGVPTVVVGQAEETGKSSTLWVLTVLHEHFHQIQQSQPDYYEAANALGLSGGDEGGMWMLDYAFSYDSVDVGTAFSEYQHALAGALAALDSTSSNFSTSTTAQAATDAFLSARARMEAVLSPEDFRYFSFQIWQEGIARYTEHRIAKLASEVYTSTSSFASLKDAVSYEEAAELLKMNLNTALAENELDDARRVSFYAVGAAEAHLLDTVNPGWQSRYFDEKFDIGTFFGDQ